MVENGSVIVMDTSLVLAALISTLLLLTAIGLLIWHVRVWRAHQKEDLDAEELLYHKRQFGRRMQTSGTLGGLAVAMFVGYLLTLQREMRTYALALWIVVLLALGWVTILAVVDIFATRRHFNRMRCNYMIEQAKLKAEARRLQAMRGNGKPANQSLLGPEKPGPENTAGQN
jgi:hypothetical protein